MKRRAEMEMGSEIRSAIEELSIMMVKVKPHGGDDDQHSSGYIPLEPFLSICNLVLQVLDKMGPVMAVLRQDIHENIKRLEKFNESNPSVYSNVVEILKKEIGEGKAKTGPSCSKAFVWLTRALDFTVALLQLLVEDFGRNIEQAVKESYNITLKPWHGWISSTAYRVALELVPDSKSLITLLMAKDENDGMLKEELQKLISLLLPVLEEIHIILGTYGLDRLKST